ncbi:MAG: tetraacyldisaccharide 4'-kinase [Spirochaetales bacterium]|nr:tetraacyldisaccharide 4'-kinase [Spirochaetales bacterium]
MLLDAFLLLLSRLYTFLHEKNYRRRLKEQVRFADRYVLCVGNLSMGGTGKTPVCDYLARELMRENPVLVLRGYRRRRKTPLPLRVSDGQRRLVDVDAAGDEAFWLARRQGVAVVVDPRRSRAIEKHSRPGSLVILDDAFQNPLVYGDFQLVLIDVSVDPASFRIFPAGRFREGAGALRRADAVLFTRTDLGSANALQFYEGLVREIPGLPLFYARQKLTIPEAIQGKERIGAFCGLGNPGAFFTLLESSGVELSSRRTFPDHHPYGAREIQEFLPAADVWLTTEKDAVRLKDFPGKERIFLASLEISLDRPEEFLQTVLSGPRRGRELY